MLQREKGREGGFWFHLSCYNHFEAHDAGQLWAGERGFQLRESGNEIKVRSQGADRFASASGHGRGKPRGSSDARLESHLG
jgi:hypothetical protein